MKVAIINLTGGGISGGYKKYLLNVLPLLASFEKVNSILCASPHSLAIDTWFRPNPKITFAGCEPFRPLRHRPDAVLKLALDAFNPDVIFVPLERRIDYKKIPVVTMLQNMAPLSEVKTSRGITERLKRLIQAYETKTAVKNAAIVIAPTAYVKNFLTGKLGVREEKVSIVNYGSNPPLSSSRQPAMMKKTIASRFIFTAGSLEIYRGLEDLLRARALARGRRTDLKLAVAGEARASTAAYLTRLKKLSAELRVEDDILWLGKLSGEELSWCYGNCAAFVMTSRVESFGLVALEAMSHGCNCISTSSACLPEVFGDCAVYYPAENAHALALAIEKVMGRNSGERGRVAELTKKRAGSFSWAEAARKTADILEKATGQGR